MTRTVHPYLCRKGRIAFPYAILLAVLVHLVGCAVIPEATAPTGETGQRFEVPRRSMPLTPEQEKVRAQATSAVEADVDGHLARYIESVTIERDPDGQVSVTGVRDLKSAMARGPLVISADDMRELFPQYAESAASRSTHSVSVHEAVTAMAQELYERALAIDDPRRNNAVLFTAGGVASGKTTATRTIDQVQQAANSAQIVYDSTMRRYSSAQKRVRQALAADKSVSIVYVYTPIELSARWLVNWAVETGRVIPAAAAARSHWQSQLTFLKLQEDFEDRAAVSFLLVDNSGERPMLVQPASLRFKLYGYAGRFADMDAFIAYTTELVRKELEKWRTRGRLIPETEAAFAVGRCVGPSAQPVSGVDELCAGARVR